MANLKTNTTDAASLIITEETLKTLLQTIISYTGKAIGIYTKVFGNKVCDLNTDELYKNITKYVKDENKRQSIAEKLAVVAAAESFYIIDYANKRESIKYTTEQKAHDLKEQLLHLSQAISFFKGEYVKKNAIGEFILSASIALMYYKELAIICNDGSGKNSPEYKTYRTYLVDYYTYAKEIVEGLISERIGYISEVKRYSAVIQEEPYVMYEFYDGFENKNYSFDAQQYGEKGAKEKAEQERENLIETIENDMCPMFNVLEQWEDLIENEEFECIKSEAFGDISTNYFDDILILEKINKIVVYFGCVIDGITIMYEDGTTVHHGGYGGKPAEVNLASDEYIVQIDGYIEEWLNNSQRVLSLITFKTNEGNTYGPFGRRVYTNHKYKPIKEENLFTIKGFDRKLIALFGNSDKDNKYICRIGAYWE